MVVMLLPWYKPLSTCISRLKSIEWWILLISVYIFSLQWAIKMMIQTLRLWRRMTHRSLLSRWASVCLRRVQKTTSTWRRWVPQGSVLGPFRLCCETPKTHLCARSGKLCSRVFNFIFHRMNTWIINHLCTSLVKSSQN